jgi:cellulose synthase/poly-beta-1,6-N-acetylglucosamine synthase-like glycosyltransferase
MFEIIVAIIVGLYSLQVLIYLVASHKRFPRLSDDQLPTASVIVAVRDEERVISRCLNALDALEYPDGKLQIVVINDGSTDTTGEIIREFIKGKSRFTMVNGVEPGGHLRGKSNALVHGLKVATGEVILTTDADCKVNPLWVKTLASYFTDGVGLLGGMTSQETGSAWKGMQHLDFMYLLGAGSGTINAGLPLSVIGNNMAYLKKAYDETGGYENMPFSVTEDSQILAAISNLKKYKIIYPLDKDSLVESLPVEGLVALYKQKKRWGIGGLNVPPHGLIVLGTAVFSHLLSILVLPFNPILGLFSILVIVLSDLIFLFSIVNRMKLLNTLKYFPFFEIYYFIYIIFLPIILLFSKSVDWKGRKF